MQDLDEDGEMDTTFMGIPIEPWAFSTTPSETRAAGLGLHPVRDDYGSSRPEREPGALNRRRLLCGFFGGWLPRCRARCSPRLLRPRQRALPGRVRRPPPCVRVTSGRRFLETLARTMEGLVVDPTPVPQLEISGRMPRRLEGVLFRNGPAGYELGGHRAGHWFDGDGMVQRVIDHGRVSHRAAFVRTHKFLAERDAGGRRPNCIGRREPRPVARPDDSMSPTFPCCPSVTLGAGEAGSPCVWAPSRRDPRHAALRRPRGDCRSRRIPGLRPTARSELGYASAARRLFFWQLDCPAHQEGALPERGVDRLAS